MKPNFALDLSHDGIGLLHRGADDWHSVGNVSLDDPEFSEKLGFLRQTAAALESSGLTTKLVIPNSQIRFITAEAPGPTDADRNDQVRQALIGTTPYPIEELVFDWTKSSDSKDDAGNATVHVAAVARETLEEAEGFAKEHGFNPVSFVATPNPGTFSTAEPFFGASASSKTLLEKAVTVEPDVKAIRVLGAAYSKAPASDAEETPPASDPSAALMLEIDAAVLAEPEQGPETKAEPEIISEPVPETTPDPEQAPKLEEPEATLIDEPAPSGVTAAQLPDLDDPIPDAPVAAFSTRRETKVPTDDGQALQRIESIESRLAILPEGRTSRAPKLSGARRGTEKSVPEPSLRTPPPLAAKSPAKPPKATRSPANVIPPSAPAALIDLSGTATPAAYPETKSEEQAMTVFGARRKPAQAGKPRYLGLSLMVALLVILGGIGLWSTFFLGGETASRQSEQNQTLSTEASTDPVGEALAMLTEPTIRRGTDNGEILAPAPLGTVEAPEITTEAVSADPQLLPTGIANTPLSPQAALAAYEDTGIWQLAPKLPSAMREDEIDTLYITSVDPHITSQDAIALPEFSGSSSDVTLELQGSPAAQSEAFVLDARGLVIPSIEGTLTPDGVMIFAGPPPRKPGIRGNRVPQVVVEPDLTVAGFRPKPRPANLVQQSETAQETEQLGGYTRLQLASLRPKPRPYEVRPPQNDEPPTADEPVVADTPAVPEGPVSALAVVLSSAPKHRPRGFANLVKRSRAAAPSERATAATAVPRNQTVQPSAPTRASVARLATTKNAINLRRTSLIGVYGSPSKRRALVRLSNGRYVKVKVGERVDGGKVAAIGQSELRYVKGGRTIVLRMPKS